MNNRHLEIFIIISYVTHLLILLLLFILLLCYVTLRRYFNDWQERGHLEPTDLNTLFGNIQEVYEFNVILLNELEQSGSEPIKIAKCFIKLRDEFDAYTQYW